MMRTFVKFKPRSSSGKTETRKMSEARYQREMLTWRPFRIFGVFASVAAMSFTAIAVCSKHWMTSQGFYKGVWDGCLYNISRYSTLELCPDPKPYWQHAVIGLLIFSVGFGLVATILSICGVCTATLPKKIYYYHSAGEIYFICALSTAAALIVYPLALRSEKLLTDYQYGVGYGIGWGSAFFFLAAAICMCLDDVVRTFTRGFCRCCNCRGADTRV